MAGPQLPPIPSGAVLPPLPEGLRFQGYRFRDLTEADLPVVAAMYAETRASEWVYLPQEWSDEQKAYFFESQFVAQHVHYMKHYYDASFALLEGPMPDGGEGVVGRLYLHRGPVELRIVDITIFARLRNLGIGGALLRALQDEAAAVGKPLSIHVEMMNPARRLYDRLGFREISQNGPYWLMEWRAPGASHDSQSERAA